MPTAVAEANLGLRRMHIHIDISGGNLQQQHRSRISPRFGQSSERFTQRVLNQLVADVPTVQVDVLIFPSGPGQFRQTDDAAQADFRIAIFHRQSRIAKIIRPGSEQSILARGHRQRQRFSAVVGQRKRDVRIRQRKPKEHLRNMTVLGRSALDELPPGGRVEKQVANLDGGSDISSGGLGIGDRPAAVEDFISRIVGGRAGQDAGMRHRPDARERFAAEPHRGDAEQIIIGHQLAGGMRCERQQQITGVDPPAIIDDPNQLAAAVFNIHMDVLCPSIDRVLNQLFDNSRWPLDHLAGRDAVDQRGGELLDAREHAGSIWRSIRMAKFDRMTMLNDESRMKISR